MDKKTIPTKTGLTQNLDLSNVKIPAQLKSVSPFAFIVGAAIGGAAMYLLDPVAGANRRSTIVSRAKSYGASTTDGIGRQFSSIAGLVTSLFASLRGTTETTTNTAADVADRATTTASAYARKVSATDPDAYTATH